MRTALIKLHIAIFLWGFTGILGQVITLNEGLIVWWRMLIAVVSLWGYALFTRKIPKVKWRDFFTIGGIGFVLALHWLCFYGSIKYANVSVSLTCLASSALIAALLEPLFFGKRLQLFQILLGLCTLAGIGLVYVSNLKFTSGVYIGVLAALLTVLVSIFNKKIVGRFDTYTIMLYQFTGGFLGLTICMPLYFHLFPTVSFLPSLLDFGWLLFLSWVCTILTFILYIQALNKITPFVANMSLTLEPVYGIILAFVILKENKYLGWTFYPGFALIFGAVMLQMIMLYRRGKRM